jgi:hypothetical protein
MDVRASMLDPIIAERLQQMALQLQAAGQWPAATDVHPWRVALRARFDPTALARLSDTAALELFDQTQTQSLVASLSGGDDDLVPGTTGARTILDAGLVRRAETGAWLHVARDGIRPIAPWVAAEIAATWRDQLVAAAQLLAVMPDDADDVLWARCTEQLRRAAPDVAETTWAHRYLECVIPDRLSAFHTVAHQWFYLIKLWQVPPVTNPGRSSCSS